MDKVKVGTNHTIKIAKLLRDTHAEDDDVTLGLKNQRVLIVKKVHKGCHVRYIHRRDDNRLIGMLAWYGLQLRVMYNNLTQIWELRDDNV